MTAKDANHGPMWSIVIKSLIFTIATVTATGILATTIRNSSSGEAQNYTAIFNDATSVNRGDDVRIAGVKVGTVTDVSITDNRLAKVSFTIRKGMRVDAGSVIQIKFRNLVGQRYLAVEQPPLGDTGTDRRQRHQAGQRDHRRRRRSSPGTRSGSTRPVRRST